MYLASLYVVMTWDFLLAFNLVMSRSLTIIWIIVPRLEVSVIRAFKMAVEIHVPYRPQGKRRSVYVVQFSHIKCAIFIYICVKPDLDIR